MALRTCEKCGSTVGERHRLCQRCGARLPEVEPIVEKTSSATIIRIVVGLIVLVGIGAYWQFYGKAAFYAGAEKHGQKAGRPIILPPTRNLGPAPTSDAESKAEFVDGDATTGVKEELDASGERPVDATLPISPKPAPKKPSEASNDPSAAVRGAQNAGTTKQSP